VITETVKATRVMEMAAVTSGGTGGLHVCCNGGGTDNGNIVVGVVQIVMVMG